MKIIIFKRSDLIGDGKESGSSVDVDMSHVYMYYSNENVFVLVP